MFNFNVVQLVTKTDWLHGERFLTLTIKYLDAVVLTNIVNSLDMMPQVQEIIRGQSDMLDQRNKQFSDTFAGKLLLKFIGDFTL